MLNDWNSFITLFSAYQENDQKMNDAICVTQSESQSLKKIDFVHITFENPWKK